MLTIEALRLHLPGFDLGPLNLHVQRGEHFVLLGPSGAGKTTLLECIAGFRRPDDGALRLDGRDRSTLPPRERSLAVVYQQADLFPHLTVAGNLGFALRLAGWPTARRHERVLEVARLLRIEHRLSSWPAQLSHGESRRAALGRALAAERPLLLLDEPLDGLDPPLRRELRLEIGALRQRLGLTIVHVTHDLDEALAMADRMAVLEHGRIAQVGTPAALLDQPASAAVARTLMVPNYLEGQADPIAGRLHLDGGGTLPAPVRMAGRVRARFHGATLASADDERVGPQVWIRGIERRNGGEVAVVALHEELHRDERHLEASLPADGPRPRRGDRARLDLSAARWTIR